MNESFELPVLFREEELLFPARMVQLGYTHRFIVDIYGGEVAFEPDEEQNYRAIIDTNLTENGKTLNIDLLKAIANTIETVIR